MNTKFPSIYTLFVTIGIAVFFLAYSSNPPNGKTGAPGDGYCEDCHEPGNPLGLDGEITIENFPSTINPNTDYTITVRVTNPNGLAFKAGFQAVVLDGLDQNTGDLSVSGPNPSTSTSGSREYVKHTPAIVFPGSNEVSWDFTWTSPNGPDGEIIKMYAAGNIGSGGGDENANDLVKSTNVQGTLIAGSNLTASIISSTYVSCAGGNDGAAIAYAEDGTPPYSFLWPDGTMTAAISNLLAGNYTVTVTDDDGATATATAYIFEPTALELNVTSTPISCVNPTATAAANVTSGTSPYFYSWPGGGTGQTESGLSPGTYTVTVTDTNDCTITATFSTTENTTAPFSIISPPMELGCLSASVFLDGTASSFGASISYEWSTFDGNIIAGQGTTIAEVDQAGTYSLLVTDNDNGCTAENSVTVTETTSLVLTISSNDVSCNGGNDGSIDLTATGGQFPYFFQWDDPNSTTTEDLTNAPAGQYCVIVEDNLGCTATICTDVSEPSAIAITGTPNHVYCNGSCDGSIDITVTGGTTPYTFEWDIVDTVEDPEDLCAGTYTLIVTDDNGCTETASFTIDEPSAIEISGVTYDECPGDCNGEIDISVSGGTGIYTYQWNTIPTQNTQDVSGLCAGTYSVTVTDDNNCIHTAAFTIAENNIILIAYSITEPSCSGACDGDIFPTISGGAPPYTFQWSTGSTACDIQEICAGSYSLTVTDVMGCTESTTMDVGEPFEISITSISTSPACSGGCDGAIDIDVEGGTGDFTYDWDASQNTEDIFDICEGSYSVTITDENGCTAMHTAIISSPSPLNIDWTVTDASCHGICDGAVDLTIIGGTSPYTYDWDNGSMEEDPQDLCAGLNTVTVSDANGCASNISVLIMEPDSMVASLVAFISTCNGSCDGGVSITVTGGTEPYSFLWSNNSTACDLPDACAGNYFVTITDANGCTIISSSTVNEPAPLELSADVNDPSCFGACDGSILSTPFGGIAPYTYEWNTGSIAADIFDLCAETYVLLVTDHNGCSAQSTYVLSDPPAGPMPVITGDSEICEGTSTVLDAGFGYATYQWNDGSNTQTIIINSSWTYCVTVSNTSGCTGTDCFDVVINAAPTLQMSSTNETAPGANNGTATATIVNGTSPYTFDWSNGGNTQTIENLAPDNYCVTVIDGNGCTSLNIDCVDVGSNGCDLEGNITLNEVSCTGGNDGTATANVAGGTEPYNYNWSIGSGEMMVQNLSAGTVDVTITDTNGCVLILETTISEPAQSIIITSTQTNISCNGVCDGTVNLVVTGGTQPYSYEWSGPCEGPNPVGICAGTFTVTVTDANACTAIHTVSLSEPLALNISPGTTSVTCNGDCDGELDVIVTGGTPPYAFEWDNGAPTCNVPNVCAGNYVVTVTDSNGCIAIGQATVNEPEELALTMSSTDENAQGTNDGTATADVLGGTLPYTYLWDDPIGQTSQTASNLTPGNYCVTVTDDNGCTITNCISINAFGCNMTLEISNDNFTCFNECNGAIDLTVNNGTAPFTYSWSSINIGDEEDPVDLCLGNYAVTVTDANQCTATIETTVIENTEISGSIVYSLSSCMDICNGMIDATINGGISPYTYLWSTGADTEDINGLCDGDYTLTVTDAIGCTAVLTPTVIIIPDILNIFVESTNTICPGGGCDGSLMIFTSGGTAPYSYDWDNDDYDGQDSISDVCFGFYTVTVTDANGCSMAASVEVTEPFPIVVNITTTSACFGQCDGSVDITAAGGTAPYTFIWNGDDPQMLCPGPHSSTVTDANDCSYPFAFNISENPEIIYSVDMVNNETNMQADGAINITVNGGSLPYTFKWLLDDMTVSNEEDPTDLSAGIYTCEITDVKDCIITTEEIVVDNMVAVYETAWEDQIKVFPNPVEEILHIDYNINVPVEAVLEVYDIRGVKLVSQYSRSSNLENDQLNLRHLPNGVYTLRISAKERYVTFKIVKMAL